MNKEEIKGTIGKERDGWGMTPYAQGWHDAIAAAVKVADDIAASDRANADRHKHREMQKQLTVSEMYLNCARTAVAITHRILALKPPEGSE